MKRKHYNGTYGYLSDVGKVRIANEDATKIVVNSNGDVLLMVADGMGGHNKGDFASMETIEILSRTFKDKKTFFTKSGIISWLRRVTKLANTKIYTKQDTEPEYSGMGTTLALAFIYKDKLITLNSGDSRIYWLKDNKLEQLSEDQTYVNYLFKSGQISQEEMLVHPDRHVLTNAIGLFPSISVDIKVYKYRGEKILVCSDGLYNNVSEKDITNILNTKLNTEEKLKTLVNLGNFNGGSDNISVALWESIDD